MKTGRPKILSDEKLAEARKRWQTRVTLKSMAEEYRVSPDYLSKALRRRKVATGLA